MNFSIVIPVFNEELNIINLIEEIFDNLLNKNLNFEIVIVNDASNDKTLEKISKIKNKNKVKIKIINNHSNLGQSLSIIKGIEQSYYNTIVTLDADGQNNPKDIRKLLIKYFSDDMIYLVGGIRSKRMDSLVKKISSKIANKVRRSILKDNCNDTGCSLKVFDKQTFLKFPHFDGIHRFLPALFSGYNKQTFFMNVDHRPRIFGQSKYGTFKRLFAGIKDLIRVYNIIKKYRKTL
tara:strand:- start:2645 stop:3349 length:705 start_codon:yes stop_codon:yes gene_type:complete